MTDDSLINAFLSNSEWAGARRSDLAGDASARRYLRLHRTDRTAVLMDARAEPRDSMTAFVRIADHLRDLGLSTPRILLQDPANGLLLLEDFGDGVFARLTTGHPAQEVDLYGVAVDVLVTLHRAPAPADLPRFDAAEMARQATLVHDHYTQTPDPEAKETIRAVLETVLSKTLIGDPVLILRDYHAENLIWLPERAGVQRAGLLDFQDAMAGPAGYDLVSLLHDARRDVPTDLIESMTARYCTATGIDPGAFAPCMAVLSAQRSLRILGIFARLSRVASKPHYVDLIPRVWMQLQQALTHPVLGDLAVLVHRDLPDPDAAHLERLRHP